MDTLSEQALESFLVQTQAKQMLPGQESVLVRVLTELFKHRLHFLHVKFGFEGGRTTQLKVSLEVVIDGKHLRIGSIIVLGNY